MRRLVAIPLALALVFIAGCQYEEEAVNQDAPVVWQDDDHRVIELRNSEGDLCLASQYRWDDGSDWHTESMDCS